MKRLCKFAGYIAVAVIFSIALSGCQKKTTTGGNIVVWSFENEDAWKTVIKNFEKDNKGYKLVYQKQTLDSDYENRVLNSILSGQGPDVWSMPNDWVYRHKEKLYPMPDKMVKATDLDKKFVPAIKQSVMFDNKIYALSPSAEPLMVFYNPKLFSAALKNFNDSNRGDTEAKKTASALLKEPPSTWTDFVAAMNLITQKNGDEIEVSGAALGTGNIANAQDILYLLMLQNETSIFSDDLKLATFNLPKETSTGSGDQPGNRAIQFYTSFADSSSENYSWNDSIGDEIDAFANDKVAMIFGYSSLQNTLAQKYPNFKYKKAYAPQLETDAQKIVDYARFNAFGVSKLSKNPAVSWSVIGTLADLKTTTNNFNSATKQYTSEKATSYDVSIKNRTAGNPEKLSLATAKSLVKGRYPVEIDQIIKSAITSVNEGSQDSASALSLGANAATELLRKEGW